MLAPGLYADGTALALILERRGGEDALHRGYQRWAQAVYQRAVDMAHDRLGPHRLPIFLKHLQIEEDDGHPAVTLAGEAAWIEEGAPEREMLPDLLASPKAKVSKKGRRYVVVPLRPGDAPSSLGAALRGSVEAGGGGGRETTDGEVVFRVAADGQSGWRHPGIPGAHIMADVAKWGERYWDEVVFPGVVDELIG